MLYRIVLYCVVSFCACVVTAWYSVNPQRLMQPSERGVVGVESAERLGQGCGRDVVRLGRDKGDTGRDGVECGGETQSWSREDHIFGRAEQGVAGRAIGVY